MNRPPRLQTFNLALDALERVSLPLSGEFFRIVDCTAPFNLYIDGGSQVQLDRGLGYRAPAGERFERLDFEDRAGVSNAIQFVFGDGEFFDNRMIGPADVPAAGVPAGDAPLNNGAQTLLVGASASTVELILSADPANTQAVRIGPIVLGSMADGVPLLPGEKFKVLSRTAWYGFASLAGQKIAVIYLTRTP